jgi:predicted RNA-binding Zn ribbon-like protein
MFITKKQIFIKDYKNIFLTLSNLWITSDQSTSQSQKERATEQIINIFNKEDLVLKSPLEISTKLRELVKTILNIMELRGHLKESDQIGKIFTRDKVEYRYKSMNSLIDFVNQKLSSIILNRELSKLNNQDAIMKTKTNSLVSVAWIQLSDALANKEFIKICQHIKCNKLFSSKREKMSYCDSKCQTRAKSYRAYHLHSQVKPTVSRLPTLENLADSGKLPPERYVIPDVYDPDFGFFEQEKDKKRILGS